MLEAVLADRTGARDALDSPLTGARDALDSPLWRQAGPDGDAAWHSLSHCANDADIRMKDPDYAVYQRDELRDFAGTFRNRTRS